jgi:hypothetical protein
MKWCVIRLHKRPTRCVYSLIGNLNNKIREVDSRYRSYTLA